MLPVLAIVGRPNVGKSTLFNCLTRTRNALVSDLPGMTRDRQYGQAEYADKKFIVIDTAGIIDDETNGIDALSIQQSIQAIKEADKVLFVVDGKNGLTPTDMALAEKLRSLNKPISIAVNKTEGSDKNIIAADFFQLGFGEPYAIAAAHKSGLDELIQGLFEDTHIEPDAISQNNEVRLAIIGKPNVGKSTLTNRMLGEDRVIVYDQPGTTRDSIFIPLERLGKHYMLIDTAGVRRRGKVFEAFEKFSVVKTLQAIENANVVLFIIDAREEVTDQDLKLLGFVLENGKSLVVGINKWDGLTEAEKDDVRRSIDRRLHFVSFAKLHFISALHGSGVGNLFSSIDEAFESANKKISTSKLNDILKSAITTHNPPMMQGRRVKLRYAHLGGHNPPLVIIHGNQVESLPESYRTYLSNFFVQKLKLVGTPVRVGFKNSENPFKEKRNILTPRQKLKKERLMKHVKKK